MALSNQQLELLKAIKESTIKGDRIAIAKKAKKTVEYVSMVLSPNTQYYNQEIVDCAVRVIEARKEKTNYQIRTVKI